MKSKFLILLTAVFVLGLGVAVYAFNKTTDSGKTTATSCCAKKDDCPLKNKSAQTTAENKSSDSCCDKADCCCKGDSCPMKASGEKGGDCCANCCGGSCPMKNKQTEMSAVQPGDADGQHNRVAGS